jgi:hypothetical protein
MSNKSKMVSVGMVAIIVTVVLFTNGAGKQNGSSDCDILVTVPDTNALPNSQITIPVYLDNYLDTIIGFSIWIQTDRPHTVFAFQTDSTIEVDTTYWYCLTYSGPHCVDSIYVPADSAWDFIHVDTFAVQSADFDTTGTLISGWEYVSTRSFSAGGTDILMVGIANLPGGPVTKGFAPQTGGTLVKIIADVFDDTDPFTDSIVQLIINKDFEDNFNFVTPNGPHIWLPFPFWDTSGFVCSQWQIDSTQNPPDTIGCLNWVQTPLPPWDSIVITVDTQYVLDTNAVCINDGSVKILPGFSCGDINDDGMVGNILDLTFLIDYIFRMGLPPVFLQTMDVNCDGSRNILDLTMFVDRIFRGGPPLCSAPSCPSQ